MPVFVAVVEQGGFSAAAAVLGLSKSAVSKRVTHLENTLGTRLLHRTTRKLSLTEAGERYFEHALAAVHAGELAQDAVAQLQAEPSGELRIAAPMSFGRLHVAGLVPALMARYPKLQIKLTLDDRFQDLVAGGFDVAIRVGDLPDSTLVSRKLAACRHVICAAPEYIERQGQPRRPAELVDHNCLLYSFSHDVNQWTMFCEGEPESVRVSGNYQVNNSEALLAALLAGQGIGRLPSFVAGPALKAGRLIALFEGYRIPDKTIYAVMPERKYMPAKLRAFVDFTAEYFGGDEPYWDQS